MVIFNTGAGLKYADVTAAAMNLKLPTAERQSRGEVEKDRRGVTLPARHRAGGVRLLPNEEGFPVSSSAWKCIHHAHKIATSLNYLSLLPVTNDGGP